MTAPRPRAGQRGLTLAAIGRRASVSPATVSKVINGRSDVAPGTRRKVQAILDAYNHPSRNGERGQLVDVVMIDIDDPWAAHVLSEIERAARESGLAIIPSVSGTQAISDDLLTRLLHRENRGLITIFADLDEVQQDRVRTHGIPYVAVAGGRPATTMIEVDFRAGVREAADHLLSGGHRKIGMLLGARNLSFSEQRLLGLEDALKQAGGSLDPSLVRWGRFDQQSGADHARFLLELDDPPTAIIAGSDTMAIGVYRAIEGSGLRVGHDVAVVGFDDRPEARWLTPPLTTIRMPLGQLADAAVARLIGAETRPDQPTRLPGTLIIRESSSGSRQ